MPCDAPTFCFSVPEFWLGAVEASYFSALNPRINAKCPSGNPIDEVISEVAKAWGKSC
jgi:hypothetical protein